MASLTSIRSALASTVDNVPNLRVFSTFQQQINPPAAIIAPQPGQMITFDTIDNSLSYLLRIILLVSYAEDQSSQSTMDALLDSSGGNSVLGALRADPSLGGQVSFCIPVSVFGYGLLEWAGQTYFGTTIIVQIVAP